MTWDPVPWFVGGGAQHSPEVARLLAYASTSGAEGIVGTADLRVRPLSVPGPSIRVGGGAALIRDSTSGMPQQTYVARLADEDVVEVTPTGSSGGRSDLVVARIEDPFVPGASWQDPTDPTVGPYVFTRIITNVPAGTTSVKDLGLGYSAVALARIDLPASTGTVTSAMITDLRKVAIPRRERILLAGDITGSYRDTLNAPDAANDEQWPDASVTDWYVDIPEWATHAYITFTLGGVATSGNLFGYMYARLVDGGVSVDTGAVRINTDGVGNGRQTIHNADLVSIPSGLRGRDHVRVVGRGWTDGGTGEIALDNASVVSADIEFTEKPV